MYYSYFTTTLQNKVAFDRKYRILIYLTVK
nr:MAG TPA: hypothetical protein [Bacteriophage sp.]